MNDPARVIAVDTKAARPGMVADINGTTVKMREVGNAYAYRKNRRSVEAKAVNDRERLENGMIAACKTLLVGEREILDGPSTDVLRRNKTLGWYGMYGSPEWDWFEKAFPCTRRHDAAPTKVAECVSIAWSIMRRRVVRLFRKPAPEYEWRYSDED